MKDSGLQTAIGRADSGISIESVVSIERQFEKICFSNCLKRTLYASFPFAACYVILYGGRKMSYMERSNHVQKKHGTPQSAENRCGAP